MVRHLVEGADPRWRMQAPLTLSQTITTPGSLSSVLSTGRTVHLADPDDLLSLTSQMDTVSINGRTYTSVYEANTRTFTTTSPSGRQGSTRIDALGRVLEEQVLGVDPVHYTYDARGRLATIRQGTEPETRTISFCYNSSGYLDMVVDPLGHEVSFEYDAVGRVIEQTLPDSRVISYSYDANGNLTSLTPPGRSVHAIGYTPVDLPSEYTPPDVNPGNDQTHYTYNLDR